MKNKCNLLFLIMLNLSQSGSAQSSVNIYSNLNFSLSSEKNNVFAAGQFDADEKIIFCLVGINTNRIWYRHFPCGNFDFHLYDGTGKEVEKSIAGKALTAAPPKPTKSDLALTRKFVGYSVDDKQGEYRELFRPDDIFIMTNKGTYQLEIKMRLCVIMKNQLPDVGAMMDARNVTGKGLAFANDFGVLTSPPLRVKIIKE